MSKELEEAAEWIKERIAYIAENCDLTDLDNKKVYYNFKTILNYVDNSISKEVIENKIEKYKKMSDDFYSRFIESGRLNIEIRDAGFSCDRKIEALQEVMEGK